MYDPARVLTPEATAHLGATLQQAARDHGVEVYVVTFSAVEKGRLDDIGAKLTSAWTEGVVGAVLVFDDLTGKVTIGTSEETDRKFSPLVLNMRLREPLMAGRRKGLSPEKLERSAILIAEGLAMLNYEARRKARRRLIENVAMGLLVVVVGGFAITRALSGREEPQVEFDP